jgi:hypothetical protein
MEYQVFGSINYSEKQKEHAIIITQDIAYWTMETFDIDPEEDTEYYRTIYNATYPEASQAMIENDDGYLQTPYGIMRTVNSHL